MEEKQVQLWREHMSDPFNCVFLLQKEVKKEEIKKKIERLLECSREMPIFSILISYLGNPECEAVLKDCFAFWKKYDPVFSQSKKEEKQKQDFFVEKALNEGKILYEKYETRDMVVRILSTFWELWK